MTSSLLGQDGRRKRGTARGGSNSGQSCGRPAPARGRHLSGLESPRLGVGGAGRPQLLALPGQKPHLRVWGLGRASWVPRGVPGRRKSPVHGSPSSALSHSSPTSASFPAAPGRKLSLVFVGISSPKGWGGGAGGNRKSQSQSRSPRKRNGGTYLPSAGPERPSCPPASRRQPVWVSWAEAGSQFAASGPWREGGGRETEARAPMFTAGRNSQELRRPQVREI